MLTNIFVYDSLSWMSDHKVVSGWQRFLPLVAPFRMTIPHSMHPLAPEEREAQGQVDKNRQISVTGFNRIDNIVSLINSETRGKITSSSACPRLPV
ncbi:hypothetical protein TNCV_1451591 [Trichonephila clavipes]|nr:hypothetical protein TNCV_1451591 [Trichonephila clavipes]